MSLSQNPFSSESLFLCSLQYELNSKIEDVNRNAATNWNMIIKSNKNVFVVMSF